MSDSTPVACKNCGEPIRFSALFGAWFHVREDILASKPYCLGIGTLAESI